MGRGDPRTRRGKIFRGSYGTSRPKNKNKKVTVAPPTTTPPPTPPQEPVVEEATPVAEV